MVKFVVVEAPPYEKNVESSPHLERVE